MARKEDMLVFLGIKIILSVGPGLWDPVVERLDIAGFISPTLNPEAMMLE